MGEDIYFDDVINLLQEVSMKISDSEVLTEEKRRELISRVRSIKSTLEGNHNKPWITSEEGKKALYTLKIDVAAVLKAIKNLEYKENSLEELIIKLNVARSSTRKIVDIIKK